MRSWTKPLALLGMDACLMSTFEVAYEVQPHVMTVVGSEETEPGDGWPYTHILRDLTAHPEMQGSDVGRVVVQRYIESYRGHESQYSVTQCAIDTAHLPRFADTFDELAVALRRHLQLSDSTEKIARAQARSVRFSNDLVDVATFCRALQAGTIEAKAKEAAGRVLESLKPGGYVVAEGHLGATVEGCGGVTVYFPSPLGPPVSKPYSRLSFAKRGWDEFLTSYQRTLRGD